MSPIVHSTRRRRAHVHDRSEAMFRFLLVGILPSIVQGQFCTPLANQTWAGFAQAISDSYLLAVLCPFEISGDGCPSIDAYPDGLVFGQDNDMIIECNPDLNDRIGDDANTKCIIDCPGRHFTVRRSSAGLILTNMILSGATDSSIFVEQNGRLEVVNAEFHNNSARDQDGGAIMALDGSIVEVEFSSFRGNEAVRGGAIFSQGGNLDIRQCDFQQNEANAAGGAIVIESGSRVDIRDSSFNNNQAADGGALYLAEFGELDVTRTSFENNLAILGGAVFTGGVSSFDDSSFMDNFGLEGGGAINSDAGSATAMIGSTLMNNGSGGYGPAVYDRFNTGIVKRGNTACGNDVIIAGVAIQNRRLDCDGIFALVGRRRVRCLPFENECVPPTAGPSSAPTMAPTNIPTIAPSSSPTITASATPTGSPSFIPSIGPTEYVSASPTTTPSEKPSSFPTKAPTHIPTTFPSYVPTTTPSQAPSVLLSDSSSQIPSDAPSLLPSLAPSQNPPTTAPSSGPDSRIETDPPFSSQAPSSSPSITRPVTPSTSPTTAPSEKPSSFPTKAPTLLPTTFRSYVPTTTPSQAPSVLLSDSSSQIPSDAPSLLPSHNPTIAASIRE